MTPEYNYYLVGGAVRDRLLGLDPKDLDYCVEAPSFEAMQAWVQARIDREGGKIFDVPRAAENFTIRCKIGKEDADFVLCRKESGYSDGRRPDVVEVGTVFDDLARRDFTVNAMAISQLTGELLDPYNGAQDLKDGLLRCVGDPLVRFSEDYLRIVRAVRFSIVKGFALDPSIDDALARAEIVENLSKIARDRIEGELKKCFQHNTFQTLLFLQGYYSLSRVLFHNSGIRLIPSLKQ